MRIAHEPLGRLIETVFVRAGCRAEEAEAIAGHMTDANLSGHDSHGMQLVEQYVKWIGEGKVVPNRTLTVLREFGAVTVVDGGLGFGQQIGRDLVDLGVARAAANGIAMVALRNVGHLGRLGAWAERAAAAGCASMHFLNSTGAANNVAPFGGSDRRLSPAPFAFGMPARGADGPVILDVSTAAVAVGKVRVAANKGVPLPEPVILRPDGTLTDDPNALFGPPIGAVLPFGGHKGYGLNIFNEMFGGLLTGGGANDPVANPPGQAATVSNMLSIFIDPRTFADLDWMEAEMQRFAGFVKASPPRDPARPVLLPGEIERQTRAERAAAGIPVDPVTWGTVRRGALAVGLSEAEIDALARPVEG